MKVEEVIVILNNRITTLNESKKAAFSSGDLDRVVALDNDIETTTNTILALASTINAK